ncbi:MAG: uncharacterized protein A8A55_0646 [Amphiamblys sp. WSBS2006]|nr:MAG: uncharacterized protein A8A55_0646 [Amphiamblys sp. WSBS2006]
MEKGFLSTLKGIRKSLRKKKPLYMRIQKQTISYDLLKKKARRGFPPQERPRIWRAIITAHTCDKTHANSERADYKISKSFFRKTIDTTFMRQEDQEKSRRVVSVLTERGVLPALSITHPLLIALCLFFDENTVIDLYCKLFFTERHEWRHFPVSQLEYTFTADIFSVLLLKHAPRIYQHIAGIQKTEPQYTPKWNLFLFEFFISVCTPCSFLRLVDCYLVEGYKVIYRHSLAYVLLLREGIFEAATGKELDCCFINPISDAGFEAITSKAFSLKLKRRKIAKYAKRLGEKYEKEFVYGTPTATIESGILRDHHVEILKDWVPYKNRVGTLKRVFSVFDYGHSLKTFYSKCEALDHLVVVVQTREGSVFGAFISQPLSKRKERHGYFGNGFTFLFGLCPVVRKYKWDMKSGDTSFVLADNKMLCLGCCEGSIGLWIDTGLENVQFGSSKTFKTDALTDGKTKTSGFEAFHFFV